MSERQGECEGVEDEDVSDESLRDGDEEEGEGEVNDKWFEVMVVDVDARGARIRRGINE